MSDKTREIRCFAIELPTYPGDAFATFYHEAGKNDAEAFRKMADMYAAASSKCRRLAGFMKEHQSPDYDLEADSFGNDVDIEGPSDVIQPLVSDGIVTPMPTIEELEAIWEQEELEAWKESLAADPDEEDNAVCADFDSDLCRAAVLLPFGMTGGWVGPDE